MRRAAIRELVEGFFDGSEEALIEFLRGARTAQAADFSAGATGADALDTVLL